MTEGFVDVIIQEIFEDGVSGKLKAKEPANAAEKEKHMSDCIFCKIANGDIPSSKAFLLLKELKQGVGVFAVHLYLLEAWEFGAKVKFAELVNAFVGAWCLLAKLVTGEIEDGKAL